MSKPSLFVIFGVENGVVGNNDTISGSRKIRAKLIKFNTFFTK